MNGNIDDFEWEGNPGARAYSGLTTAGFTNLNALALYLSAYISPKELRRILSPLMPKGQMGKKSYVEVAKALKENYEGGGESGAESGSGGPDSVVDGGTGETETGAGSEANQETAEKVD